jgi:hypothetical protein
MTDTDPVTREGAGDAPRDWSAARRHLRTATVIAGALTVAGLPIGLLWSVLAPRTRLLVGDDGRPVLADPESTAFFTADVTFALLTMAVGAIAAIAAYTLVGRKSGTAAVIGLAVGGALGSLVAWQTGRLWGLGAARQAARAARIGDYFSAALTLRATGVLVLGALIGVAVFGLIEAFAAAPRERANQPQMIANPFPPSHPGAG